MQDQQAHWLSPDDQARLAAFKAYAVHHPLLGDVDTRLTQVLLEPAGFAHVLVYGPSGVGKTTMLRQIARRAPGLFAHPAPPGEASKVHVLIGTYDLLDFRNLNRQAARRGQDLHFPRYQSQHEADRRAFQGALHSLLQQIPLNVDRQDLMNHWFYCYERSIGCVGVLKDWLVRAVSSALPAGMRNMTLAHLEQHALSNAQCERMTADASAAEQKLHYTESSRERLWQLLGMSGKPVNDEAQAAATQQDHTAPPAAQKATAQAATGRVGQRAPRRAPVGDLTPEEPLARCSFAGHLDLAAERLVETGVAKVECPECGVLRTLHPQGKALVFPSHPKRLKPPPRADVRWVRRGSVWERSDQSRSRRESERA